MIQTKNCDGVNEQASESIEDHTQMRVCKKQAQRSRHTAKNRHQARGLCAKRGIPKAKTHPCTEARAEQKEQI